MMFKTLVFAFLIIVKFSFAQENVKEFYSEDGRLVSENKSSYYLVGTKIILDADERGISRADTVYAGSVKAYYTESNKLKSTIFYIKGVLQGDFVDYYDNGAVKEKGVYIDDRKSGTVTSWHSNGQLQKVLKYYSVDREYNWKTLKFDIVDYWDSLGNQLIKSGNGDCVCLLSDIKALREEGKVVNGKKDQLWKALSGDTLKYEEQYDHGELIKGISYYKGNKYTYTEIDQMAEMKGGVPALMEFLRKNIRYPGDAKRRGKEGRVYVKFIVNKEGLIIDPKIAKGVYQSLDEEALRVVSLLKKWTPGKLRGVPVKSQFILPVYFKLD